MITCGNRNIDGSMHKHETVAGVRSCYSISRDYHASYIPAAVGFTRDCGEILSADEYAAYEQQAADDAHAEYLAELRVERWYEERGANEPDDPYHPF